MDVNSIALAQALAEIERLRAALANVCNGNHADLPPLYSHSFPCPCGKGWVGC